MDNYFLVKNNLVQEPKHRKQMGDAIWLYLCLVMWSNMTPEKDNCVLYSYTYAERQELDIDLVRSQLKLLAYYKYIVVDNEKLGKYEVRVLKPIRPKQ